MGISTSNVPCYDPPRVDGDQQQIAASGPAGEAAPILDYAPPLPWYRRRRGRRILALVVIAAVLLPVGIMWGPLAWYYAKLQYRLYQCLRYTAPAGQVVYEADPARVQQLLQSGGDYVPDPDCGTTAFLMPKCFVELDRLTPPAQVARPIIFLHERITKSGVRRLVVVQHTFSPLPFLNADGGLIIGATVDPGSLLSLPHRADYVTLSPIRVPKQHAISFSLLSGKQLRIFAGQPDPADSTHFTFACELNRQTYAIDGWLQEDAKRVLFSVRNDAGQSHAIEPIEARLKNGNLDTSSIKFDLKVDELLPATLRGGTQPSGRVTGRVQYDGGKVDAKLQFTDGMQGKLEASGTITLAPSAASVGNLSIQITNLELKNLDAFTSLTGPTSVPSLIESPVLGSLNVVTSKTKVGEDPMGLLSPLLIPSPPAPTTVPCFIADVLPNGFPHIRPKE